MLGVDRYHYFNGEVLSIERKEEKFGSRKKRGKKFNVTHMASKRHGRYGMYASGFSCTHLAHTESERLRGKRERES